MSDIDLDPKFEASLRAAYATLPRREPGAALDAAILGAAHRASRRERPRWPFALASAAVMALAIGIGWQLQLDRRETAPAQPELTHKKEQAEPETLSTEPQRQEADLASTGMAADAPASGSAEASAVGAITSAPAPTPAAPPAPVADQVPEANSVTTKAPAQPMRRDAGAAKPVPAPESQVVREPEPPFVARELRKAEAEKRIAPAASNESPDVGERSRAADVTEPLFDAASPPQPAAPPVQSPPAAAPASQTGALAAPASVRSGPDVEPADAWLARILAQYRSGDLERTRTELERFRAAHPDHPLPAELEALRL
jgi:Meckel syndrome type 1 protein